MWVADVRVSQSEIYLLSPLDSSRENRNLWPLKSSHLYFFLPFLLHFPHHVMEWFFRKFIAFWDESEKSLSWHPSLFWLRLRHILLLPCALDVRTNCFTSPSLFRTSLILHDFFNVMKGTFKKSVLMRALSSEEIHEKSYFRYKNVSQKTTMTTTTTTYSIKG